MPLPPRSLPYSCSPPATCAATCWYSPFRWCLPSCTSPFTASPHKEKKTRRSKKSQLGSVPRYHAAPHPGEDNALQKRTLFCIFAINNFTVSTGKTINHFAQPTPLTLNATARPSPEGKPKQNHENNNNSQQITTKKTSPPYKGGVSRRDGVVAGFATTTFTTNHNTCPAELREFTTPVPHSESIREGNHNKTQQIATPVPLMAGKNNNS